MFVACSIVRDGEFLKVMRFSLKSMGQSAMGQAKAVYRYKLV